MCKNEYSYSLCVYKKWIYARLEHITRIAKKHKQSSTTANNHKYNNKKSNVE